METTKLKQFAQYARRSLLAQVSNKLQLVLSESSPARRESPSVIKALESAISIQGKEQIIEQVAYTWFNRFCALRFMDVNRFTRIGVISPAEGQFQPEILAEAKMGHIDEKMVDEKVRQKVFALLDGKAPSQDPQGEAYRLLVVAACNDYHRVMPYLFERIADYTELLMPDDLLSGNSILAYTREAMTPYACQDVEVIGWLYQFYISEKKDTVMARKSAVPTEDIPAVTQLFTPHWIVRYLVENSIGRLWMLNHPNSKLREHMPYYIEGEAETDFLKISKPEDIRLIDPAVGSGHMLTYAFDLLYLIYEEMGTEPNEIPEKILTYNLYGIEIDERAGELAAFSLTMKARAKQRRFFTKGIRPNILVLQNITFSDQELNEYMNAVGRDLFTQNLRKVLTQFEQAKNFGSLIQPCLSELEIQNIRKQIEVKDLGGQLFLRETYLKVLRVLEQAEALTQRYHVVVANPPYMGSGAMNGVLKQFAKDKYPYSKPDLFSMFIEKSLALTIPDGWLAMVTMQSWMFLSSFSDFRKRVILPNRIFSGVHIGFNSFPELNSKVALAVAFVLNKRQPDLRAGLYLNLNDASLSADKDAVFRDQIALGRIFRAINSDFNKIPESPIAYWATTSMIKAFDDYPPFETIAPTRKGMVTAQNSVYVRLWHEVSNKNSGLDKFRSRLLAASSEKKWFSYLKGGGFRKWYGNKDYVVNWGNDGELLQTARHPEENRIWATNFNLDYIFQPNVNWGAICLEFSARISYGGELFDAGGSACFPTTVSSETVVAFLNSKVAQVFLKTLNPTLNFQAGNISNLPFIETQRTRVLEIAGEAIVLARADWDNFETSWDFRDQPLLRPGLKGATLEASWRNWVAQSTAAIRRMQELETENNRLFIAAYGLEGELQPEVPEAQITLARAEARRDMAAFLSYAVGCMLGRYSPDHPGLILADAGDSLREFLEKVGKPLDELNFAPDEDGVIPILEGDWFEDDIVARTRDFLRATFGEATLRENLRFIEDSLGKDLRKYFLTDFYKDHLQTYKKRPIYWLFSSPKGTFNALIYLHRYRPDTVSVVLNGYLREFRSKLSAQKNHLEAISISSNASQAEKTKALREIEKLSKMMIELEEYERDVLYPLATEQVKLDLDDGVKLNYPKLGKALKKISGFDASDE